VRRPLSGLSPEHLGKQAALHLRAVCGITPRSGAVHLVASPLYHSASLLWCGDHLQLGHTVVLLPSEGWDPEVALAAIEGHKVTGSLMVPTHFRRLSDLPKHRRLSYDVSSLRHVVHTGAACPPSLKMEMLEWWGPVIYEVYGAAEGAGTRVGPQEWLEHPGTVGRSHGRVRVVREDGTACPPGEIGKVYLKTAGPAKPQSEPGDRELRSQGFSSVGDLGYLDEDGFLFLAGRQDDIIISGGVNIHPAEIESILNSHPGVTDVVVVGIPDKQWGQRLKAMVQPKGGTPTTSLADELRALCRSRLAAHKCPRDFELVASLPRDHQGKLRRRERALGERRRSDQTK
jgi:long-chain acyl-CoA synthetase